MIGRFCKQHLFDTLMINTCSETYLSRKVQMRKQLATTLSLSAMVILAASSSYATIVYEDTFDNDGLATNAGIGGGLASRLISGADFQDNGSLTTTNTANGYRRGVASSINSFLLTDGFILEVHFNGGTNSTAEHFSLGQSQYSSDSNAEPSLVATGWAGNGRNGRYDIGVITQRSGDYGLKFNDGSQSAGAVHNLVTTGTDPYAAVTNTIVLTVTPDDQFSYVLNGAPAVTGEIDADGNIDLSQPLYFNVWSQSSANISYVKITDIPEPSSLALLGLGGLLIARCRRG